MSDLETLANELSLTAHRFTRQLQHLEPGDGLTLTQISALTAINTCGLICAGALAALEHVRPPSITRVLRGLEAKDLIALDHDSTDGRQVMVRITAQGRDRLESSARKRDTWLTERLAAAAPADLDILRRAAVLMAHMASH